MRLTKIKQKLAIAVRKGVEYGAYGGDKTLGKFIYASYTCVAFSILSFDPNSDFVDWDKSRYDCRDQEDDIGKSIQDKPEYYPGMF